MRRNMKVIRIVNTILIDIQTKIDGNVVNLMQFGSHPLTFSLVSLT